MDLNETNVLCTKHRLWKKQALIRSIIDAMIDKGYRFKELVLGEPSYFVFAETYDEIDDTFRKKGGYYGIRIKFERDDTQLEINSNNDGVNNVHYTIFADTTDALETAKQDLNEIRELIRPSNDKVEQASEFVATHPRLRNTVIIILVGVTLYFLGVHVFLFNIVQILFSFSPFLFLYILFLFLRRRR